MKSAGLFCRRPKRSAVPNVADSFRCGGGADEANDGDFGWAKQAHVYRARPDAAGDEHACRTVLHQSASELFAKAGICKQRMSARQTNLSSVGVAGEDEIRAGRDRVVKYVR